jgi:predicted nucleic acid-binding protein
MVKALFDTNIVIDHLRGMPQARDEIRRHEDKAISVITWMEVMVGATPTLLHATQSFLEGFRVIDLDKEVAERSVTLRRRHRIKLPDAVVWASAQVHSMLLVTRDGRDFRSEDPAVRIPYQL